MATTVRSYSKINLGLGIGPARPDGFHSLCTLYQTLALHDLITVAARPAAETRITLSCTHPRVPTDARNTVWKMVERTLAALETTAEVEVHIAKNLPIQGGMGAGSANAAAALLGLEAELKKFAVPADLSAERRLAIAAEVGSDVPLFLVGGTVLGYDRGQRVVAVADVMQAGSTQIPCVVVLPARGVSTPQAFRDWDARLTEGAEPGTLEKLSRTYASVFAVPGYGTAKMLDEVGTTPVFPDPDSEGSAKHKAADDQISPEKPQWPSREQSHQPQTEGKSDKEAQRRDTLATLVCTGIENDFETVVFLQYPLLAELKQVLQGAADADDRAVYAALSGSGSALFGLYRTQADAVAAQQRLQKHGVQAIVTTTLPRPLYWSNLFAEVTDSRLQ